MVRSDMFSPRLREEVGDLGRWELLIVQFAHDLSRGAQDPDTYKRDAARRIVRFVAFCRREGRDPTRRDPQQTEAFLQWLPPLRDSVEKLSDTTLKWYRDYIDYWYDWWATQARFADAL